MPVFTANSSLIPSQNFAVGTSLQHSGLDKIINEQNKLVSSISLEHINMTDYGTIFHKTVDQATNDAMQRVAQIWKDCFRSPKPGLLQRRHSLVTG